jgi:hypothetical protein
MTVFGKVNTFYVALFAWVMTFYFLATGVHDWKLWVVVSIAFLERMLMQFLLYLMSRVALVMANRVKEAMKASAEGNDPFQSV